MGEHREEQFRPEYSPDGTVQFAPAVVACGDGTALRFVFGWARHLVLAVDRPDRIVPPFMGVVVRELDVPPDYSTTVEWAGNTIYIADRWPDAAAWANARLSIRIGAWETLADVPDDLIRQAATRA